MTRRVYPPRERAPRLGSGRHVALVLKYLADRRRARLAAAPEPVPEE